MAAIQVVATELQVLEICIFLHKRLSFFNSYIDVLVSLPVKSELTNAKDKKAVLVIGYVPKYLGQWLLQCLRQAFAWLRRETEQRHW